MYIYLIRSNNWLLLNGNCFWIKYLCIFACLIIPLKHLWPSGISHNQQGFTHLSSKKNVGYKKELSRLVNLLSAYRIMLCPMKPILMSITWSVVRGYVRRNEGLKIDIHPHRQGSCQENNLNIYWRNTKKIWWKGLKLSWKMMVRHEGNILTLYIQNLPENIHARTPFAPNIQWKVNSSTKPVYCSPDITMTS